MNARTCPQPDTPHTPRLKNYPACLPASISHQVFRPRRGDHHRVLHVLGSEHLGLAPRRHARDRVDPVGETCVRVDVLGDPRLGEADRSTPRAVPPSERLDVYG